MTLKQEISYLESARQISPDSFELRLGIALRSKLTRRSQERLVKAFKYCAYDIDYLIKLSYRTNNF